MLFLLFPRLDDSEVPDFQTPLYISFDPVPEELVDAEKEPQVPAVLPQPQPPTVQEPEPVEPAPVTPPPQEEIVVSPAGETERIDTPEQTVPAPIPGRPTPTPRTPVPSADRMQPPSATEAPAEPEREPASRAVDPEPAPAPTPTPPPPPVRQGPPRSARTAATTTESSEWVASQLQQIADIQEDYLRELEEYEARQQALADSTADGSTSSDPSRPLPIRTPRFTDFQDELSRMISGIESANNVVRTSPDQPTATPGTTSSPNTSAPGIDGVIVGEGAGQRQLVTGSAPDLSYVELPVGFPPEYLVEVRFTVARDGTVTWAAPRRPTPVPQLDSVLSSTVRSWRFEAASGGGSSSVSGSVTIVVDTRSGN